MDPKEIANSIKSLDQNSRQKLARIIRTDANVWNGINGVGTVQENLPKGKFQGLVKEGKLLLDGVDVFAQQGGQKFQTKTNGEGFFSIELAPGSFDLIFIKEGFYESIIASKSVISESAITINSEMTRI